MSKDAFVCRCSDIDVEEIRELIASGYTTIDEIKRLTRLAMGPCQGRNCIPLVMRELANATNIPLDSIRTPKVRQPALSVKLGEIADAAENIVGGGAFHD